MFLGVDYYPEHWPLEMMDDDIRRMKEMGVDTVRIGEFAWHMMESENGKFDFAFFESVIKKLKENGIKVMFGTPTATFPAWLSTLHPDILSRDEAGITKVFGGRRQYCFNSKEYLRYSLRIVEQLVSCFAEEDAIFSWQMDNELGHEGSDRCFCDQCKSGFQEFLKKKYQNIEHLNKAWGTIFWGQTYNCFEEIPLPVKTVTSHNPAMRLDHARFRSFSVNEFTRKHVDVIRKCKGECQLVTTNVSGGFFEKWFDHEENLSYMDIVSFDNYPVWGGLKEPMEPAKIAMTLDFARGLQQKNFWIVEELIGAQGHEIVGYRPRPGHAKLWSFQAFAHGCSSLLYFRWRAMNKGAEQFCYGVLDHDNRAGRKYEEAKEVFNAVKPFEKVIESAITATAAVLYDYDNIWAWRFQPQSLDFNYDNEIMRVYRPLHGLNVPIDVIPSSRDLSAYKLVILPVQQIMNEELASRLKNFVKNGGTLLFTFRTGIKDRNNNLWFNEKMPGAISDLIGAELREIESLQPDQECALVGRGQFEGAHGKGKVWRDFMEVTTAEVIIEYEDPFAMGYVCGTRNQFGKGSVYYLGSGVDEGFLALIIKDICKEIEIEMIQSPMGLEVVDRQDEDGKDYRFIMNHNSRMVEFEGKEYPPYHSELVCREDRGQ